MLSIISILFRAIQMLFAIVVVGLSATFMKDQHVDSVPVTTRFSVFVGAFGMIVAALGFVAIWIDAIPSIIPMAIDSLAALFFLAGGIAWAVGMEGQTCSESSFENLYKNPLLNQGCITVNGDADCYIAYNAKSAADVWNPLKGACQRAFSNESFQFLGFGAAVILVGLGFLMMKRKGSAAPKNAV